MSVKEFYEMIGGDYNDVASRLMKEERIIKYLKMFCCAEDYDAMLKALDERHFDDAFRNAHNLKGVSANLALTPLFHSSSELCEALRHGEPTVDITDMLDAVKKDYADIIEALSRID